MGDHLRRQPRHPIAKRYPAEPPPRIEVYDRKGRYSRDVVLDDSDVVCNCFPRPSTHTIPSMFYDAIKCPHVNKVHIQPAQETQFNYPWTANSIKRRKARGYRIEDDVLSYISEENEEIRNSPPFLRNRPDDVLSIATAPPFRYMPDNDPRQDPPYTAPEQATEYLTMKRRAASVDDVRQRVRYRPKELKSDYIGGYNVFDDDNRPTGNSRIANRQFTGNYVDPKSGKVYNFNVNYSREGVQASRKPVQTL